MRVLHSSVREATGEDNYRIGTPLVGDLRVLFDIFDVDFEVLELLGAEIDVGGLRDHGAPLADVFLDEIAGDEREEVGGNPDILLEDGTPLSLSCLGRLQNSGDVDAQLSGNSDGAVEGRFDVGGVLAGEDRAGENRLRLCEQVGVLLAECLFRGQPVHSNGFTVVESLVGDGGREFFALGVGASEVHSQLGSEVLVVLVLADLKSRGLAVYLHSVHLDDLEIEVEVFDVLAGDLYLVRDDPREDLLLEVDV